MFTQTLSKLFTVARPHPWGGAAYVRSGRSSGRQHRHTDRPPQIHAAHGATAPWNLLGLPLKAALMSAAVVAGFSTTHGQILTGMGAHLPLGSNIGTGSTPEPGVGVSYAEVPFTSFTGTWGANVLPAWQGTFTATGPIPSLDSRPSGTSIYNFSGLPTGVLPVGTYLAFSDIDSGSGVEHLTLKAFGIGGAPLTEWLRDTPFAVRAIGSGVGGAPVATDMPGWDWNVATSTYTFDGTTVPGNPTIAFYVESGLAISSLEVTRDNSFSNFGMLAPSAVPEPSEYVAIAGMALVAFGAWRRTRRPEVKIPACSASSASAV